MSTEPYIFVFDSLNAMLAAGSAVIRHPDVLLSDMSVIFSNKKWYISFSPVIAGLDGYRLDCLLACMCEFGSEIRGGVIRETVLKESGRVVAENSDAERLFAVMDQSVSPAPYFNALTAADTSSAPNT